MKLIVSVILKFLVGIILGIFEPIIDAISNILPSGIDTALQGVASFFTWLLNFVLFVLSWLPFTAEFWAFFISVIIFSITITITLDIIKLAVRWWHALAP